jgi:hypothetical protein
MERVVSSSYNDRQAPVNYAGRLEALFILEDYPKPRPSKYLPLSVLIIIPPNLALASR